MEEGSQFSMAGLKRFCSISGGHGPKPFEGYADDRMLEKEGGG